MDTTTQGQEVPTASLHFPEVQNKHIYYTESKILGVPIYTMFKVWNTKDDGVYQGSADDLFPSHDGKLIELAPYLSCSKNPGQAWRAWKEDTYRIVGRVTDFIPYEFRYDAEDNRGLGYTIWPQEQLVLAEILGLPEFEWVANVRKRAKEWMDGGRRGL